MTGPDNPTGIDGDIAELAGRLVAVLTAWGDVHRANDWGRRPWPARTLTRAAPMRGQK